MLLALYDFFTTLFAHLFAGTHLLRSEPKTIVGIFDGQQNNSIHACATALPSRFRQSHRGWQPVQLA